MTGRSPPRISGRATWQPIAQTTARCSWPVCPGCCCRRKTFNLLGKVVDGFCGAVVVQRQQRKIRCWRDLTLFMNPMRVTEGNRHHRSSVRWRAPDRHSDARPFPAPRPAHGAPVRSAGALAFGGDDPFVNLVLAQDAVVVARHEEVAQEPQRAVSFAGALQVAREFFPLALDTVEIVCLWPL